VGHAECATASSGEAGTGPQSGAEATINYATQDFETEVMRLTHAAGVPLVLEAVGGEVTVKSMRCLAPFGYLVNYGNASNQQVSLPLSSFREQRAAMGFSLPSTFPRLDNQAAMWNSWLIMA
jgi:NADPH2:quinone reductase